MFKRNEYYYEYVELVSNNYVGDDYSEKHHIIPKSMGGCDNEHNLVRLTFKDHVKAHELLFKCCEDEYHPSMSLAYYFMTNIRGYRNEEIDIDIECLEEAKLTYIKNLSKRMKNNNIRTGTKLSEEHIAAIKKANTGIVRSDETKRKMAESKIGDNNPAKRIEVRKKIVENKSIGTYITPWGDFLSAEQASREIPIKLDACTIRKYCIDNEREIPTMSKNKLGITTKDPITFKEFGFRFEEKKDDRT